MYYIFYIVSTESIVYKSMYTAKIKSQNEAEYE